MRLATHRLTTYMGWYKVDDPCKGTKLLIAGAQFPHTWAGCGRGPYRPIRRNPHRLVGMLIVPAGVHIGTHFKGSSAEWRATTKSARFNASPHGGNKATYIPTGSGLFFFSLSWSSMIALSAALAVSKVIEPHRPSSAGSRANRHIASPRPCL